MTGATVAALAGESGAPRLPLSVPLRSRLGADLRSLTACMLNNRLGPLDSDLDDTELGTLQHSRVAPADSSVAHPHIAGTHGDARARIVDIASTAMSGAPGYVGYRGLARTPARRLTGTHYLLVSVFDCLLVRVFASDHGVPIRNRLKGVPASAGIVQRVTDGVVALAASSPIDRRPAGQVLSTAARRS